MAGSSELQRSLHRPVYERQTANPYRAELSSLFGFAGVAHPRQLTDAAVNHWVAGARANNTVLVLDSHGFDVRRLFRLRTPTAESGQLRQDEGMTRQLVVDLPEELVVGAEKEAKRSSRPVDAVVMEALVEHLGWRAVEETRAVNTDLSVTEAEEFALSEVASARVERAAE